MVALAHEHVPLSFIFPHESRATNERRWRILVLNTPQVDYVLNTPPVVHLELPIYKHLFKVLVLCRTVTVIFSNIYVRVQYVLC